MLKWNGSVSSSTAAASLNEGRSPLSSSRPTISLMGREAFIRKLSLVLIHGVARRGANGPTEELLAPRLSPPPPPPPRTSQCKLELEKLIKSQGN